VTQCACLFPAAHAGNMLPQHNVLGAGASHTLWKVAKGWGLVCRVSKRAAFVKLCDAHAHGFLKRERG